MVTRSEKDHRMELLAVTIKEDKSVYGEYSDTEEDEPDLPEEYPEDTKVDPNDRVYGKNLGKCAILHQMK
ncbi:hypothetical protein TVAGG3_0130030 [Trichomonas vaginalis G3]|uniref:hypothetical protein n=1 Tax=Trichomonas vaginalis (strain ATCC PRA-98 / G3) TaxID=412133 RepID=UPI0021E5AB2F|nr:hypothetical protein TVAGG3_0130030 [Trichomonas vaginalis G3]KAI5546032.1 hypothetical protein TVAGG3_0130030 [Trichomonas vaginalis G3]